MFKSRFLPRIPVFCLIFIVLRERARTPPGSLFLSLVFQERICGINQFSVAKFVIFKKLGRALAAIAHCRNTLEREYPGCFCITIVSDIRSHDRALYATLDQNSAGAAALPLSILRDILHEYCTIHGHHFIL